MHATIRILAEVAPSFLAGQGLALLALLVATAALILAYASWNRTRAAAPSVPAPAPATVSPVTVAAAPVPVPPVADLPFETMAIIAACVAATFGKEAQIAAVGASDLPGEMLRQQWSMEGRRQIYSSHQVR